MITVSRQKGMSGGRTEARCRAVKMRCRFSEEVLLVGIHLQKCRVGVTDVSSAALQNEGEWFYVDVSARHDTTH